MKHGTSTAPPLLRAAWKEGGHSGGIPSLSLGGVKAAGSAVSEALAGASPPGGTSVAAQAHPESAQFGCTTFSFPQNLCLWGWGVGFPAACNMEGFFGLDFFTAFVIGM